MRPSPGPHDRAPLGLSPHPPLPWGTGHAHASWALSLPFDCPLRNLAWARGLALSTFSHPECEALWTAGREGAAGPTCLGPRVEPLLLAGDSGGSQVPKFCSFASIIS